MMDLGNRPSNLPPTTPGLFVIPPRSYLNVAEGRRYIRIRILGPSGITEDRSVFQVMHSGWTLRLRFYYPEWFLDPDTVLQANSMARISDAEVTAFDDGVLMLRENDQERPFNDWIIALPIRVEQHLRVDDVEFIARATEGHDGQFTSFFAVTLRGYHLGRRSAATPSRIRVIHPAGSPVPNHIPSNHGIPTAQAYPVPPAPPQNPPEPPPNPPQQPNVPQQPPHVAGDPMSATPASIHRDLSAMTDGELRAFEISFSGLMSMPNLNLSENERSQGVLIAAMIQHEISRRAASPSGFNP